MEIGEPQRIHRVEPVEDPIPHEVPTEEPQTPNPDMDPSEPVEVPA